MGRETASAMEWKFLKPRYICGGGLWRRGEAGDSHFYLHDLLRQGPCSLVSVPYWHPLP